MRHTLPEQPTICELILDAQDRLAAGLYPERARLDAETLLLHIVQQHNQQHNRAWLLANWNNALLPGAKKRLSEFVARRVAGEPIQYILGKCEFYGLPFHVTRDVLIPRPETEHLVEKAIAIARCFPAPRILDVGVGSGVIAVALGVNLHHASITATDRSAPALALAQLNAQTSGVANRIRFLTGDLLAPVTGEQFEIVVSNPPYIPAADRSSLAVEVRDYEPPAALFAGDHGLAVYRRLIPEAFAALVPGGSLVLEIGYGQQEEVRALLTASGFCAIEFTPDLQGIPRVAAAQRP